MAGHRAFLLSGDSGLGGPPASSIHNADGFVNIERILGNCQKLKAKSPSVLFQTEGDSGG
ncbi:hypothetical protein EBS67_00030 [bacterium]|nr:hypothetical protein [bacterium]